MTGMELLPLLLIVVVFWFLLIRPQRRRQQELARTQRALAAGDEVMLGAGIYGTVRSVADDHVELEVSPGTTVRVARAAVVRVLDATERAEADTAESDGMLTGGAGETTDQTAAPLADDNEGRADRG